MAHDHSSGHHHHHHDLAAGDTRIGWAVAVNVLLTVAQVIGGVMAGSISLIADAVHNLSDAMTLVIALAARRIARRPASETMTFGYGRAETVAALVNYTTLILISLYLANEAIWRMLDPQPVDGWIVVVVAAIALLVDVVTAVMTFSMARDSMNIRAAFVHNVADALTSVAVMVGGALVLLFGWGWVDPLLTLGISVYILKYALQEIGPVIRILMLGTPPTVEIREVMEGIAAMPGVREVHNLFLWQLDEKQVALQSHLVIEDDATEPGKVIREVKLMLSERFDVGLATLEAEPRGGACVNARPIGQGNL